MYLLVFMMLIYNYNWVVRKMETARRNHHKPHIYGHPSNIPTTYQFPRRLRTETEDQTKRGPPHLQHTQIIMNG
jgi:hypothetical protein